jgi:signal transduction histidine kinase
VWVRIHVQDGAAVFELEDDGQGFAPATTARGDGLDNMTRRAAAMGAAVEIDSAPGKGTRIRLRLPLAPGTSHNHP